MIPEHTLLLKNNFFVLTEHKIKNNHYFEVSLASKKLVCASPTELEEINEFFGINSRNYAWRFATEEDAQLKIMWASMKWSA